MAGTEQRRIVRSMTTTNELGQPVGVPLGTWEPPPFPPRRDLEGRTVRVVPLDTVRDGDALFESLSGAADSLWTYMAFGPFETLEDFKTMLDSLAGYEDWLPYTIFVDHHAVGFAAYLRIQPRDGVIEIGSIVFSPRLQRTTAATEAIYLMLRNVFALGYRRCEWKCDDLNAPSRAAADRLGFTYEGTFRQATHYKGRNRDTAWYAIVNRDWPALDGVFQKWLVPDNFDDDGVQRQSLGKMRETML
jgi:RimJ/RimL family protein N-acetyltransferase